MSKRSDQQRDDLLRMMARYDSLREAAREEGIARSTLRDRLHRHKITRTDDGWTAEVEDTSTSRPPSVSSGDPQEWGDLRGLLVKRNLNPDEWAIRAARVNEWGTPDNLARQLRVELLPRTLLPHPAEVTPGWQPPQPRKGDRTTDGLVMLAGDHHEPHSDPLVHEGVCAWLREFKPERGLILGDLLDYDRISRHAPAPEWTASLQETINAAHRTLCAYRAASPATRWHILDGNHEDRLRNAILKHLPALHDLREANTDGNTAPLLSTRRLLRLDELGITFQTSPYGSYDSAQVKLTPNLAARHGWIAKKGSGTSALATIDHLRYSVIIGHTHRQSIVYHTAHSIDGKPQRLLGCEAGTLAKIEGGLGYASGGAPDWQQGFATATIHPDNKFTVDLAIYTGGELLWRNWKFNPSRPSDQVRQTAS